MSLPLAGVVAIAENGVIGLDNRLPWHVSSDLKRFRTLTWGKPLIMGRKTFASLGRVLPGRDTIIVTRDANFVAPSGVFVTTSLDGALALAQERAEALRAEEIIIAGGSEIFAALIDRLDRLYVTWVKLKPPGDTFFPPIDWSRWREVTGEEHETGRGDDAASTFVTYMRREAGERHG